MHENSAQIILKDIEKAYGSRKILDGISMEIYPGDFICIYGKSGGGKSTLLNIIGTLETYDAGTLRCFSVNDPVKNRRKSERLRRYKIAYLFQNFALVEKMTVKENLLLALRYARVKNKTRAMEEALTHLGVADKMNSKIFELSGGEQQRVALARNLIKPFDILLADEPTGSLDRENKEIVMRNLLELNRKGKTVVVVSHDDDFRKIAKKNYTIEGGRMYRI